MAREKIGSDMGQFRFPDGTFERIEAVGESRSDFVRDAVLDRLSWCEGGGDRDVPVATAARSVRAEPEARQEDAPKVEVRRVETRKPAKRDWSADFPAVQEVLGEHRYSVPALAKRLGWNEMRLERVLNAMEAAGKVRFDRGAVVPA